MYLTQSDQIILELQRNNNITTSDMLKDLISKDEGSPEKLMMKEGMEYYKAKQLILQKDFRLYYLKSVAQTNKNKSNNKIVHPYHKILVDQKAGYVVGNPVVITAKEAGFQKELDLMLGKTFNDILPRYVVNCSNRGREFLHVYVNRNGEFDYVIIPAIECIPVYDTDFQKELVGLIRYYPIKQKLTKTSKEEKLYKVQVWDANYVTYFTQLKENGPFVPDPDKAGGAKQPHFFAYNTVEPDKKYGKGWGRVPFVEYKNNDDCLSDLSFTKKLIDDYDFQISDMSNKLADIARLVWILKGYQGENLSEFVKNLNEFGAIKVDTDGAVDTKGGDIPSDSHNKHLDRLEDNIYIFGMGVNMRSDKFGNSPSGVALKFMYALLDIKADTAIRKLDLALMDLMWFAAQYLKIEKNAEYDYKKVDFTFNRSMILNEFEMAQMSQFSKGVISDETIIANHPWVNDPKEEMRRLKKQREENMVNLDLVPDPVNEPNSN